VEPANGSGYAPLNILLLGSDTRQGQAGFPQDQHMDLSNVNILVHVSAKRDWATAVSIPRDLIVDRPNCTKPDGTRVGRESSVMLGSIMNIVGLACTVKTIEQISDIRIDHFIRMDFNGLRKMVDVVGGVTVCLPWEVHDTHSNLNLTAGVHTLSGWQALGWVRTRYAVGDGTDLGRIKLQQAFMSSLITKIKSEGTLSNPVKVYQLADAVTQALTLDPGLGSVSDLVGLAAQLNTLTPKNITFVTLPNQVNPDDVNRLLPVQPQDDQLWRLLRDDKPFNGTLTPPAATPGPTVAPSQVSVAVYNASGRPGLAAQVAEQLRHRGFSVLTVSNADPSAVTTISHGSNQVAAAAALHGALQGTSRLAAGGPDDHINLYLGRDFAGSGSPQDSSDIPTSSPPPVQSRKADQDLCSGLPDGLNHD
jgi:LCP family protein required for cell wall assembly